MIDNIVEQIDLVWLIHISSITINSGDAVGRYTGIIVSSCFLQNTLVPSLIYSAVMPYP